MRKLPWGLNHDPKRSFPKKVGGFGAPASPTPVEFLDSAIRATDQGYLAACGGFSAAVRQTTFIRFTCGNSAIPDGYMIDPYPQWCVGKVIDGNKADDNVGVNSAQSILKASQQLGIVPSSLPIVQISADAASINAAMLKGPVCFAFMCHDGFLPENLGPQGSVAEAMGPTAMDCMKGHLICGIGIMPSSDPNDKDPLLYLAETWSERVGMKGFCYCHLSEMVTCLLENPYMIEGWDPVADRGWESSVVSYQQVADQMVQF